MISIDYLDSWRFVRSKTRNQVNQSKSFSLLKNIHKTSIKVFVSIFRNRIGTFIQQSSGLLSRLLLEMVTELRKKVKDRNAGGIEKFSNDNSVSPLSACFCSSQALVYEENAGTAQARILVLATLIRIQARAPSKRNESLQDRTLRAADIKQPLESSFLSCL